MRVTIAKLKCGFAVRVFFSRSEGGGFQPLGWCETRPQAEKVKQEFLTEVSGDGTTRRET